MVYGEPCLLEGDLDPVPAQKMVGPEGEEVSPRPLLFQQINHLCDPLLVSPARVTFSSSASCQAAQSILTANFSHIVFKLLTLSFPKISVTGFLVVPDEESGVQLASQFLQPQSLDWTLKPFCAVGCGPLRSREWQLRRHTYAMSRIGGSAS